jgi:hypothetical protein
LIGGSAEAGQMYSPRRQDLVTLEGEQALFQVLWVNRERGTADLLALGINTHVEVDVPFTRLQSLEEDAELS